MVDICPFLSSKSLLFIFPHPDDEVFSCSALIARLVRQEARLYLAFASNGVPQPQRYSPPLSDQYTWDEYLRLRKSEWLEAMACLCLTASQYDCFNYPSQTLMYEIPSLVRRLGTVIQEMAVEVVFCPAYEGAHPDHDVLSFVASEIGPKRGMIPIEYTGYHISDGRFVSGEFVQAGADGEWQVDLSDHDVEMKRRLLSSYKTQATMLSLFGIATERFRLQPRYNYSAPPDTPVYYRTWSDRLVPQEVVQWIQKYERHG